MAERKAKAPAAPAVDAEPAIDLTSTAVLPRTGLDGRNLDLLGIDGFTDADRVELDRETGLDAEPLYGPLRKTGPNAEVLAHG